MQDIQGFQNGYAEAFIGSHGLNVEGMHTFVSILLAGNDMAKPVKDIAINTPELADALILALEDKADHQREFLIYRIFGSEKKLTAALKQASSPLKERLEALTKK